MLPDFKTTELTMASVLANVCISSYQIPKMTDDRITLLYQLVSDRISLVIALYVRFLFLFKASLALPDAIWAALSTLMFWLDPLKLANNIPSRSAPQSTA